MTITIPYSIPDLTKLRKIYWRRQLGLNIKGQFCGHVSCTLRREDNYRWRFQWSFKKQYARYESVHGGFEFGDSNESVKAF